VEQLRKFELTVTNIYKICGEMQVIVLEEFKKLLDIISSFNRWGTVWWNRMRS